MSVVNCDHCDRYIDSDVDTDCFVETGNMRRLHQTTIMCEWCREQEAVGDPADDAEPQTVA